MPPLDQEPGQPGRPYDFSLPTLSQKASRSPIRVSPLSVVSFASLLCFVLFGLLMLPIPGFQYDEVMFIYALWHPHQAMFNIHFHRYAMPTMLMSYLGAAKSWLYLPILSVARPSVWAVRLPMLLLAALTILLSGRLLRRIQGRTASMVVIVLLSTDIVFLVTSVFDWGPVVLQNFLLVTALLCALQWYDSGRDRYAFLLGLVLGLGLWNKALFLWNLSGLIIGAAVLGFPVLRRVWKWKAAGLVLAGLCIGCAPLLEFNARSGGSTLGDNTRLTLSELAGKAWYLSSVLNGKSAEVASATMDLANPKPDNSHHPFNELALVLSDRLGNNTSSWRFAGGLFLILLGLTAAEAQQQRRWIGFFLLSGLIGWLQSALIPVHGSIHHAVLFWIDWYAALALCAGCVARWRKRTLSKRLVYVLVAVGGASGLLTMAVEYSNLVRHSALTPWTNADAALVSTLSKLGAKRAVTADWGIANVVSVRSADRFGVAEETFTLNDGNFDSDEFSRCAAPDCWIVTHVPDKIVLPKAGQVLDASFLSEGFVRRDEKTISDTHGTPEFLIYTAHSNSGTAMAGQTPLPTPPVSSKPVLIATPAVILGAGTTGRTTISWQAPGDMSIEVHVGGPDGPLFASSKGPGSSRTGFWVTNGTKFFLEDVTGGKPPNRENTVAQVRVEVRAP